MQLGKLYRHELTHVVGLALSFSTDYDVGVFGHHFVVFLNLSTLDIEHWAEEFVTNISS